MADKLLSPHKGVLPYNMLLLPQVFGEYIHTDIARPVGPIAITTVTVYTTVT